MVTKVLLGEGVLTWGRGERISDRYGTVYLIEEGCDSTTTEKPCPSLIGPAVVPLAGRHGELIAVVLSTRKSTHIGDLFRGVSPRIPEVGQAIVLGSGILFWEAAPAPSVGMQVGLRPEVHRDSDWLDIRALYDAHEQTVQLYFQPRGQH
jgi:hypothetical protein